jgi:hypothetical protein
LPDKVPQATHFGFTFGTLINRLVFPVFIKIALADKLSDTFFLPACYSFCGYEQYRIDEMHPTPLFQQLKL